MGEILQFDGAVLDLPERYVAPAIMLDHFNKLHVSLARVESVQMLIALTPSFCAGAMSSLGTMVKAISWKSGPLSLTSSSIVAYSVACVAWWWERKRWSISRHAKAGKREAAKHE